MRSTRTRITHLKGKITDILPDDNDVFNYLGISKRIILESLTESYDLLSSIAEYPDKFETIFAKRQIAQCIDNCNEYLDNTFKSESAQQEFNQFLKCIAEIRYILKDTYISISNHPLRVDYEISSAKEDLETLKNITAEIVGIKSSIDSINSESRSFIQDLKEKHDQAIKNDTVINELLNTVDEIEENLKGSDEKITVWKSEIQLIKEDVINKQGDFVKLKKDMEQIFDSSSSNNQKISLQIEMLAEQLKINKTHQDHIQKTIEDVSRFGMAGSFKMRKDELRSAQWTWAILTLLSLGGLLFISYTIMEPLLKGATSDINQLFYKIPIIASAVWLAWFCSRQYGFSTRIREDYAYKYAISMAFEGYKNETKDINADLLEKLVELTILNAARCPERIFNTKTNHGSPYNEMFESLTKTIFSKNGKEIKEDE